MDRGQLSCNKSTEIHVKIIDHHMLLELPSAPNSRSLRTKANHRQPQALTTSPDKANHKTYLTRFLLIYFYYSTEN
ncbi:hypothetical protein CapIbe_000544 [Capra ibex]